MHLWGMWSESGRVSEEVRGRSHLHQRLLHGGPVGHPPSTLQDEIRVYVTFGLAVFRQGFPLVQFLRAPRRPGSREQKLLPTNQQIHERARTVIHFPFMEERKHRRPKGGLCGMPGLILGKVTCPPKKLHPWNAQHRPPHSRELSAPQPLFLQQTLWISRDFKTICGCSFVLFSMGP